MQGDFGKPRPARLLQANVFADHPTTTVVPLTTLIVAPLLRVTVQPSAGNGLPGASQVMIDKVSTVKREKLGRALGRLEAGVLQPGR